MRIRQNPRNRADQLRERRQKFSNRNVIRFGGLVDAPARASRRGTVGRPARVTRTRSQRRFAPRWPKIARHKRNSLERDGTARGGHYGGAVGLVSNSRSGRAARAARPATGPINPVVGPSWSATAPLPVRVPKVRGRGPVLRRRLAGLRVAAAPARQPTIAAQAPVAAHALAMRRPPPLRLLGSQT